MLGRNQRTDEVHTALVHQFEVIFRIVPLVEDQGDLANLLGQKTTACKQLLGHTVEGYRFVLIAAMDVMQQGRYAAPPNPFS
jgi:hypothetical protein